MIGHDEHVCETSTQNQQIHSSGGCGTKEQERAGSCEATDETQLLGAQIIKLHVQSFLIPEQAVEDMLAVVILPISTRLTNCSILL